MYEQKFPEPEDVVQVKVKRVMDLGAYVSLLEYGNIEGMIMLSELSKRRIRSIKNLIRAGQIMAVAVIRVDQNKGYVDLSRRRVSPEETQLMDEKYAKSKLVHSVMRHTSQQQNIDLEELCGMISWPLYAKFPHAYDAFKILVSSQADEVLQHLPDTCTDQMKEYLLANIRRRLTTQAVRLRSKVDVSCYEYGGIDAIRESLLEGLKASTEDVKLSITLIAPPSYAISTTCIDRPSGTKVIEAAVDMIQKEIVSRKGQFVLKSKVEIVGDHDDQIAEVAEDLEGSSSGSESEEDETMGELDEAALDELRKKTEAQVAED